MSTSWLDKRVLVTGATGFIGSHLVDALLHRGAHVRILVRPRTPEPNGSIGHLASESLNRVEICYGNVLEPEAVVAAAQDTTCIFHLAALVSIPYSYEHPREVLEVNGMGTLNVLLAGRGSKVQRIIVVSSSEVYGTAQYVPIDEAHPLRAQSPYAASKIAAEEMAQSFACSYGLPVTVVRPFNTYGPRQSLRAVIPAIVAQALFSERIRLGALTPSRDFNYVQDTVEGMLAVAQADLVPGDVVNLGSGQSSTIGEIVDRVRRLAGSKAVVENDAHRMRPAKSEVQRLCAGTEKVRRLTGWHSTTDLDDGLRSTIEWVRGAVSPQDAASYHY